MYCIKCVEYSPNEAQVCVACGKPFETDADKYFKEAMKCMFNGDDGDMDRATRLLKTCAILNPYHVSGRYNLGLVLSMNNQCDEAMEHYRSIAEQNPEYPGIFTAMGQAAFGSYMDHVDRAETNRRAMVKLLETAIEQDPDDVDALFSLANAYIAVGKAEKALPWLKNALYVQPDSPAIYFTMAKAFKMLNKYPEAAVMAKKSVQLSSPGDPFWDDMQGLLSELQAVLPR